MTNRQNFLKTVGTLGEWVIVLFVLLILCALGARAGTVTGQIQTATSGPIVNGTLTFTLTQSAVLGGTATIVTSPVACYTDASGNVVGEPNPLVAPVVTTNTSSGTLAAGTYYSVFAYWDASGTTFYSPETVTSLTGAGTLIYPVPAKQPATASGWKIYVGTTSGGETLQSTQTGFAASYSQSGALAAGAALSASNTTACKITFNDQLVPTFTGYSVLLTSSTGLTISGYPQLWYLAGGASGTVNLSTGTPLYQGVVQYPTAILTTPAANGQQSISGPLSLGTYPLTSATVNGYGRIDVAQYASWSAALAACVTPGCILDATNPNVQRAMGAFDVGSKQVKVEFGPFPNFTATQITLRAGLWLQGSGATGVGTTITSVGTNAQALLVNPSVTNSQVFNGKVDGIRFLAAAGNTSQDGLLSDISGCTNCNLNYFEFSNLWFLNFVGSGIHLKGRTVDANAANQFLTFRNVTALRPSGTNPPLKLEGYAGQISFIQCEFDGASNNDGGDNIYLGSGGGTNTQVPNSVFFDNLTSQAGSVDIHCDGCQDVDIRGLHSEGTPGILLVSNSSAGIGVSANPLIHLHDSIIGGTSATNAGNGYIVNVTDTAPGGPRVVVDNNEFNGTPDTVIKCANTNSCQVKSRNNFGLVSPSTAAPTLNITPAQSPVATLDVKNWDHVLLTTSATNVTTIKGNHLPGETVTFLANGGTIQFATGGNLSLGSNTSPLICSAGDSVTFTRMDLGATWQLSAASPGCGNAVKVNTTTFTDVNGSGKICGDTNCNLTTPKIGGGSTINLYKTVTDTPGAITVNANTCTDRGVTLAGSGTGATISVAANYALDAGIALSPGQAVAGTAHYRICNVTVANITLNAAATFNLSVWQ